MGKLTDTVIGYLDDSEEPLFTQKPPLPPNRREVSASLVKLVNSGATTGAVNFPEIELPQAPGTHRILNVHRNVPGVMRDITRIISDKDANIHAQMLATDPDIGYLIVDLDRAVSHEVKDAISALSTSIRTRILY